MDRFKDDYYIVKAAAYLRVCSLHHNVTSKTTHESVLLKKYFCANEACGYLQNCKYQWKEVFNAFISYTYVVLMEHPELKDEIDEEVRPILHQLNTISTQLNEIFIDEIKEFNSPQVDTNFPDQPQPYTTTDEQKKDDPPSENPTKSGKSAIASAISELKCCGNDTDEEMEELLKSFRVKVMKPGTMKKAVRWNDITGYEAVKKKIITKILRPIKYPHLFPGPSSMDRNILFYGAPGTGVLLYYMHIFIQPICNIECTYI